MLNVFFKRILQQYLHSFFQMSFATIFTFFFSNEFCITSEITTHICAGVGDSGGAVQVQGGEEVGC